MPDPIIPVQLSIDRGLAPDVELPPIERADKKPIGPTPRRAPEKPGKEDDELVAATPGWKFVITAAEGPGWHLIRRSRGGGKVATLCGLGGRVTQRQAPAYVPCKSCVVLAAGE